MFRLFATAALLAAQGMAICGPNMLEICVRREDGQEKVKFTWQICSCCRERNEETTTCCENESHRCCSDSSCRTESTVPEGLRSTGCSHCVDMAWPAMEPASGSPKVEMKIDPARETGVACICLAPGYREVRPPPLTTGPPGLPLESKSRAIHLDSTVLRC